MQLCGRNNPEHLRKNEIASANYGMGIDGRMGWAGISSARVSFSSSILQGKHVAVGLKET